MKRSPSQELELYTSLFCLRGEDLYRVTGEPLLTRPGKSYPQVRCLVDGKVEVFRLHRIKFGLHHGYLPVVVDHRDRNHRNLLLSNLRPADKRLNAVNSKPRREDLPPGVSRKRNKFRAYCKVGSKQVSLGTYPTAEEAGEVAAAKRRELYGEFYSG